MSLHGHTNKQSWWNYLQDLFGQYKRPENTPDSVAAQTQMLEMQTRRRAARLRARASSFTPHF